MRGKISFIFVKNLKSPQNKIIKNFFVPFTICLEKAISISLFNFTKKSCLSFPIVVLIYNLFSLELCLVCVIVTWINHGVDGGWNIALKFLISNTHIITYRRLYLIHGEGREYIMETSLMIDKISFLGIILSFADRFFVANRDGFGDVSRHVKLEAHPRLLSCNSRIQFCLKSCRSWNPIRALDVWVWRLLPNP